MNVKAVVKVMNFHALLRVENARARAEKLLAMETELAAMICAILNNENLRHDKKLLLPDDSAPALSIYLGSDYGFCGSVNSSVSAELLQDDAGEKIVVGKKLRRPQSMLFAVTQEDFNANHASFTEAFEAAVKQRRWSRINLVYNHYYNLSSIKQITKCIYPLEQTFEQQQSEYDDFVIEGDVGTLLEKMLVSYLEYELMIAAASAYASENVMRRNATQDSLKKLDEREQEEFREMRKAKTAVSVQKSVDSFVKQKLLEG